MAKGSMGPQTLIYPTPVLLVGATVDDKPNFMTVAWSGIAARISMCFEKNLIQEVRNGTETHLYG